MACLPEYSSKLLAGSVLGWIAMGLNLLALVPLSCWLLCIYEQPAHTAWTDGTHLQFALDDDLIRIEDHIAHIGTYESNTVARRPLHEESNLPQMGLSPEVELERHAHANRGATAADSARQ